MNTALTMTPEQPEADEICRGIGGSHDNNGRAYWVRAGDEATNDFDEQARAKSN